MTGKSIKLDGDNFVCNTNALSPILLLFLLLLLLLLLLLPITTGDC
jgi:hypothetical protein